MLAVIEREAGIPGLHVYFSSKNFSMQLDGLFLHSGVRGMVEGRDCRAANMVLPSIEAYIDLGVGFQSDANMNDFHCTYFNMMTNAVS